MKRFTFGLIFCFVMSLSSAHAESGMTGSSQKAKEQLNSNQSSSGTSSGITSSAPQNSLQGLLAASSGGTVSQIQSNGVVQQKSAQAMKPDVSASSYDPETGETTTITRHANGTKTVQITDADGNKIETRERSPSSSGKAFGVTVDEKTGVTTESVTNEEGHFVVKDDSQARTTNQVWNKKDGSTENMTTTYEGARTIENQKPDGVSGSSYDSETGETTTVTHHADGAKTIQTADAEGNKIETRESNSTGSGKAFGVTVDEKTGVTTESVTNEEGHFVLKDDSQARTTNQVWNKKDGSTENMTTTYEGARTIENHEASGASGTATDMTTGETTDVSDINGVHTVTKTDGEGKVTEEKSGWKAQHDGTATGSTVDPDTGNEVEVTRDKEGARKWEKDAQSGKEAVRDLQDPDVEEASGTATDMTTGETTDVSDINGVHTVTKTDGEGKVTEEKSGWKAQHDGTATGSTVDPDTGNEVEVTRDKEGARKWEKDAQTGQETVTDIKPTENIPESVPGLENEQTVQPNPATPSRIDDLKESLTDLPPERPLPMLESEPFPLLPGATSEQVAEYQQKMQEYEKAVQYNKRTQQQYERDAADWKERHDAMEARHRQNSSARNRKMADLSDQIKKLQREQLGLMTDHQD